MKCFRRCRKGKPNFQHNLRECILKEMEIKMAKSDIEINNDPFLLLGYGINAFFEVIQSVMYMFVCITIFCIPLYLAYAGDDAEGLKQLEAKAWKYNVHQFSLGNLGGAQVFCQQKRLKAADKLTLRCPNAASAHLQEGEYKAGGQWRESFEVGVISGRSVNKTYCRDSAIVKDLEWLERTDEITEVDGMKKSKCAARLDRDYIREQLQACTRHPDGRLRKERDPDAAECTIELKRPLPLEPVEEGEEASSTGECPSWPLWAEAMRGEFDDEGDECCDDPLIYFQHVCVVAEGSEVDRQVLGLGVASIGVFIYFYAVLYLDYVGSVQVNRYVDYDVRTITAGDYTVEFDIDRALYENFRDHYFDHRNPISEVA